jgi:protein Mpv17
MAIPLEEMLKQHDTLDHNILISHDNDMEVMPLLSANDELGNNIQGVVPMTSAPLVSISYDEYGMVQADATTAGIIVSEFSLATIQSAQGLQPQEEEADYPAFVKALFQKDANGQTLASKLFNLALLAVSFGYVFVSVFNIDRGMTRGWSPAEIGMRIPLDTWASYENSLSEKPVATKTIINIVIYLLGDWLSQTLFQRKDILDFDAARTLKNGLVGMCFGPAVHEYYEFSDWILPVDGLTMGITNRAFKILMDQTIYLSVKCSIYIIAVGLLNGETVENGTENVKNRLKPIMFTAWRFWPLVHCVTYGLIPARHRILWVNSVDLVWNAILASKARGDDVKEEDESSGDVEGIEAGKKEEELSIFERLGSMLLKFDSSQGEGDNKAIILVAGNAVEDGPSGETIITNSTDAMPLLAKDE